MPNPVPVREWAGRPGRLMMCSKTVYPTPNHVSANPGATRPPCNSLCLESSVDPDVELVFVEFTGGWMGGCQPKPNGINGWRVHEWLQELRSQSRRSVAARARP